MVSSVKDVVLANRISNVNMWKKIKDLETMCKLEI